MRKKVAKTNKLKPNLVEFIYWNNFCFVGVVYQEITKNELRHNKVKTKNKFISFDFIICLSKKKVNFSLVFFLFKNVLSISILIVALNWRLNWFFNNNLKHKAVEIQSQKKIEFKLDFLVVSKKWHLINRNLKKFT